MHNIIKNIISFSLKNRLFIVFITIGLAIIGLISYFNTPIVAFPDFTNTQIRIITLWPGRSAQEVERFVTIPIETSMNSVQKKVNLRSQSMFGLSVITLIFEDDVDDMYARQQITNNLTNVDLPSGANVELTPPSGPTDEIYRYTLESDKLSSTELRTLQDWVIDRNLHTVPGVADVVAFGGPIKTYEVSVDPHLLLKYGLTALDVYNALSKSNINVGGDVIEKSEQAYVVRGIGLIKNIHDIENTIIQNINGTPLLIKNVATVNETFRPRLGQVGRGKNNDVVEGLVLMRKGVDPSPVLDALRAKVQELNTSILPKGTKISTFYDRQNLINFCLHTVLHNVIEGILLVTAIILIFLRNWKATVIVALVIPLSLLFAFILLRLKGMFANLISIGAIDFGIIVDGAVVMVEGVFVALALQAHKMGKERFNKSAKLGLIKRYGIEMGKAIFFAKLIIIIALIPIFAFQKVEGKIFSPLAYTLGFALLGALLFTLTFVPALTSILLSKNVEEKNNPLVNGIMNGYGKVYEYIMKHKKGTLIVSLLILVGGILSFSFLGSEFLPHLNEGSLWVEAQAPMSISLTESKALADSMRMDLLKFKEVREMVSQTGRPDDGTDPKGFFNIECLVDLYPKEEWKGPLHTQEQLEDSMNAVLSKKYFGIIWNFSQPILDNVEEAVAGINASQAVKIFGDDLYKLDKIADTVYNTMSGIRGIDDLGVLRNVGQPELQIRLDQQKMALYGVSTSEAQAVIEMAIGGKATTQLYEGEKKFDIRIRYQLKSRRSENEIGELMIPTSNGSHVPLREIANISFDTGPAFIYRDNNKRFIAVKFSVRDRDLGSTFEEAEKKVAKAIHLPKGYHTEWAGEYDSELRASKRLAIVVPISLLLILLVLYIAFRNIRDVILILLNVPFALVGGILALIITRMNFSISAGIGFIALFGVCIQNGVILISVFRSNLDQKMSLKESIRLGVFSRVRPVIMTALMAAIGLLPAAMSTGIGSETQKPLAIVIIGGLISATILILLVFPIMFEVLNRKLHIKITEELQ